MAVSEDQVIRGIGHSVKRFEDARFLRGKGNYFDDITLPGMLHLEFLRSPYAHARITSIDTSAASAVEGVVAVVTGELLAQHNLAWMPTLSGDTQAVLATDKVRFQGQEVAAVIAETAVHRQGRLRADRRRLRAAGGDHDARSRRSRPTRRSSATRRKGRPTTTSTTGRPATRRRRTRPSPRPTRSSSSTPSTRAAIRPRSSAAAASPTSTRRRARRRST